MNTRILTHFFFPWNKTSPCPPHFVFYTIFPNFCTSRSQLENGFFGSKNPAGHFLPEFCWLSFLAKNFFLANERLKNKRLGRLYYKKYWKSYKNQIGVERGSGLIEFYFGEKTITEIMYSCPLFKKSWD